MNETVDIPEILRQPPPRGLEAVGPLFASSSVRRTGARVMVLVFAVPILLLLGITASQIGAGNTDGAIMVLTALVGLTAGLGLPLWLYYRSADGRLRRACAEGELVPAELLSVVDMKAISAAVSYERAGSQHKAVFYIERPAPEAGAPLGVLVRPGETEALGLVMRGKVYTLR